MTTIIRTTVVLMMSVLATTLACAQPAAIKKAGKSVFVLKTFDVEGNLLGSAKGFYIDEKGVALSLYNPMKGASSAVVIGADGKKHEVERILGANETYDVVKFRVANVKSQALPLAQLKAGVGSRLWVMPQKDVKKARSGEVRRVEPIGQEHSYYTTALQMPDDASGSPLLNEEGQVVGLMERPFAEGDSLSYAVSASYGAAMKISGLSINDAALRAVKIRKDLPEEQDQAVVMLYLGASTQDSASFAGMVEDFIGRFPKAADGYYYRALQAYQHDDFAAVQKDMELAIGVTDQKDASHYNYSRFVYDKVVMKPKATYEPWTLDLALNEAAEAYRINPQPAYLQHQAHVLYAQQRYADASDLYTQLAQTPLRSAELFYEASRCRMMMGDTLGQVALLDSAVAMFSRPYVRAAAPYLLGRSQVLQGMGKYREAIVDMNDYEELMKNQLNDNFYYMRFQTAMKGRLFQMALDDINKALALRPDHEAYLSEKASLLVRVGMLDEALSTAEQLIKVASEQSDGYLFAGLARCLKGEKEKGIEHLKKALELGDAQAEALISKYQ